MDNIDLINVDQELIEVMEAEQAIVRNPKIYLERLNPFEILGEVNFRRRYRMRKRTARFIIDLVQGELPMFGTNRGLPISAEIQVLVTLRYLAKGAYGVDMADQHGISQPTLSRIVKRVCMVLAGHRNQFITFPANNELNEVKTDFHRIAGCPAVVGSIDCTHIKIKNPGGDNPNSYINRKGFYSLNVQVISDAKCRIRDIVARWRGSVHDSRIWNECHLKQRFHAGEIQGILLGDNGYPCSHYLLTPVLNPTTNAEERYNRAHCSTRNVVERLFGLWKNKFRCFFNGMNLHLETTKAAIVALAVVHNIIINDRIDNNDLSDENEEENGGDEEILPVVQGENIQGNLFRANYILRHFN